MVEIVSWNIAGATTKVNHDNAWRELLTMGADIALLQEACPPPDDIPASIEIDPSPWNTPSGDIQRPWKAAVVKLSDRVEVEWIEAKSIPDAGWDEFAVSRPGTLAAAIVTPLDGEPFIVASMYAAWEYQHRSTGRGYSWQYADGSAHRIISDLARLIGHVTRHRIIAAGDLNIYHGHGERAEWSTEVRFKTVFDRMAALGIPFVGPQYPNGRQADPWPEYLPEDSKNVPTHYSVGQNPAGARWQLDFVFASDGMAESVQVRALNDPDEWGPSDHCRIVIAVA